MKTKGKSIFFICLAMIVSGVILFSVIYSGQMVSAAQRVETYKDNGEDESEMTQESIQSQEKTVGEQAEYMEELEEEQNIAHSEILEVMGVRNALAVKMNTIERALQTMTLTKSPQKMFAAYYADGTFNGQESVLYLNQEVVWCLEPCYSRARGQKDSRFRTGRKCRKRNYICIGRSGGCGAVAAE